MDSRASFRTRLSVLPIVIAFVLNLAAPVASIAVPDAGPQALAPQVARAASAPDRVAFTLEGCRLEAGDFIEASTTCTEAGYTTGNLGKEWAELDRVPHRLTAENKAGDQTYEVTIAADHLKGGTIGYDIISVPVLKSGACTLTASDQFMDGPAAGGADETIARTLTITQPAGSTCVWDYNMRLALGSAQYSGSSLQAYLQAVGVGQKRVPLPVDRDFPAQELSKTMSADQGQAYAWSVSKSSNPTALAFANTCADTAAARSATVNVTVTWTRSGPTASGSTLVTTEIYAKNPSERTILVSATDRIYEGTGQSVLLDTVSTASPVAVPANSETKLLTHTFTYSGSATQFNDVATATYIDPMNPDVAIPGNTTATASATAQPSGGTPANASAVITDTESITGTGLSFAVAAPSIGAFTGGYVAGTATAGPVNWSSGTVSGSGSVTFTKTVMVDEPRITTGTLSDTATVTSADGLSTLATSNTLNVGITASAQVALQVSKTIPAGSLRSGESVTFDFDVTGPGGYSDTASITFDFGDPLTKSTALTGLAPGTYDVSERTPSGWASHLDQQATITLPSCSGTVTFNNSTLAPDLSITKTADDETASAGESIGFEIELSNSSDPQTGPAKDVSLTDALPSGLGIDWSISSVTGTGGFTPAAGACEISGDPISGQELECEFDDLAPGHGVTVALGSDTTEESCAVYANTAWLESSNHDRISANDSTEVLCPDLDIVKVADSEVVSAGEPIGFWMEISNSAAAGTGTASDVTLEDALPGGAGIDWSVADVQLNGTSVGDPGEFCRITGEAPDQALECEFGDLEAARSASVHVTSGTTQDSCGRFDNSAMADAANAPSVTSLEVSTGVECPGLNIVKSADADSIVAGQEASFTIVVWNAGPGNALGVELHDELPSGLAWDLEVLQGSADCSLASSIIEGGEQQMSFDCSLGTLEPSSMADGVVIRVFADTDGTDCGVLDNTAVVEATNHEPVSDDDRITVTCPTLTIDKAADAETIVISGPGGALVADPGLVTWTLAYTLTDGPVTNAVISDELPAGLVYVAGSASDGGVYDAATNTLTWSFPTLSQSGSVTFETVIDPETVSRVAPTVNVAVIGSDQTPEDEGRDAVTVVVDAPPLGGNPTPTPGTQLPDTAVGIGPSGAPITVPVELLVAFFLGSLGVLTLANARTRVRRR